jgi:hypothetical protein
LEVPLDDPQNSKIEFGDILGLLFGNPKRVPMTQKLVTSGLPGSKNEKGQIWPN